MKNYSQWSSKRSLGLLFIRLGLGLIFALHGWDKITNIDMTVAFFGKLGFAAPLAYLVGYVEFLGGLAIILGLFTRVIAVPLAVIMLVVIFYVKGMDIRKSELETALLALSLGLMFAGPGKYSLKRMFGKHAGDHCDHCGTPEVSQK